jgi:shikimate dehydrogenase
VVVLGAGGAARAVVVALVDLGFGCIRVSNRSFDRAEAMIASFESEKVKMEAVAWDNRDDALDGATMLVNATSLGMKGYDALEIDLAPLSRGAVVADIIYTPLVTPLMAAAQELGLATAGGLRMLVEQARPAFAAWFGQKPPVTKELLEMLESDVVAKGG